MLSDLRLMRLRLDLEVTGDVRLAPYKGPLLRRALLWHLGSMWCRQPERCRNGCQVPCTCLFGRLIEPRPSGDWPASMVRLVGATPPPAYSLWDEQDRRRQLAAGDPFRFQLTLTGRQAIRQVPAFLAAVMAAAEQGMGTPRFKARLRRVEALAGADGSPVPLLDAGMMHDIPEERTTISLADGQAWLAAMESVTQFRLDFLSPVRVKARGSMVLQPRFAPLVRAIVRRLRILSQVHGEGEWPRTEYGPLLDLADGVQLEHYETVWVELSRRSRRGGRMPLDGFVGRAWYRAPEDLRPLLPVLWLGQWLGVGKGAVWGNGRFRVELN